MMNRITLLTLGLTTAACSSSSNKPTAAEYDDTAQAVGSTTAGGSHSSARTSNATSASTSGDVASMAEVISLSLGVMPDGLSLMGDGHFHGTHVGVDYNYALTCKGLAGLAIACGSTSDQATADVTWTGNLDTAAVKADVSRTGSWDITGLQSSTATISGTSTFQLDATLESVFRAGATASYTFDATATYDAVKVSTATHQVIGGAASFAVAAHHTATSTTSRVDTMFDVQAELTFNADQTASMTLDGDQHYTINLATGVVARVN